MVRRLEEGYYQYSFIRIPSGNLRLNQCQYSVRTTANHALTRLKRPEETRQADLEEKPLQQRLLLIRLRFKEDDWKDSGSYHSPCRLLPTCPVLRIDTSLTRYDRDNNSYACIL